MDTQRRERGFALVSVTVLVALIVTMGFVYTRHVTSERQDSASTRSATEAAEAVSSGLQLGRQSVVSKTPTTVSRDGTLSVGTSVTADRATLRSTHESRATPVTLGGRATMIHSEALDNDRASLFARSVNREGLGATALGEMALFRTADTSHPDALPQLDDATIDEILADGSIPKHVYSGHTTVSDTVLEGLVIVENSSALFFDNVIVKGSVISEGVLKKQDFGDFDSSTVPCLVLKGGARVECSDVLPGVAVLMPDGVFTTTDQPGGVFIEGDVVAYKVKLQQPGVIHGNMAAVQPFDLHPSYDWVGQSRGPLPWSTILDMGGTWETDFVAFPRQPAALADFGAVTGYFAPEDPEEAQETPSP